MIKALKGRLTSLKAKTEANKKEIGDLGIRIDTAQTGEENLDTKVGNNETGIESLEGRVEANDNMIEALGGRVD